MATVDVGASEKTGKGGHDRLQCVVVTPERTLFDQLVDFVALPLYDGELGVMPGRTPLIGRLGFGELRTTDGTSTKRYFVDGGFVQVRDNVVTVLTNRAIPAEKLDPVAASKELEHAQSIHATTEFDLDDRAKALARARAQLRVASRA